ncbi:hypothetical protein FY145_01055 [Agrobacterium tumefaciens]|uniref:hypothetical protein n=1 Tax=Agrobacterium tumefaciens TaxID=358 RepID=UPI0021CF40F4|nr:hypothetical protein [Agrobacterium tumefaciens]UXS69163.1 hypothetical protein FY146_01055 [Agrobacterium tumefaciens]UXS76826.1 hypothetical protein FY145_01055 [Agrobacterium tumefaciens]UXT11292.1 hypothetical protein FY141_00745 [Agrobacterium tumefaciens]UXT31992.1 hypothetical protein FY138_00725 [Agrobacterium tumefaciens]UXT72047.1 hypothetical protein FY132_00745 [Agrobacterium tumefaciens]
MTAFVGANLSASYTAAELTGAESAKVPGIGDLYVSHDNKTYRFVRYLGGAGAIAAVAGNAVGFYAPGGVSTGVTNDVTSDVSDTAANLAGVLCAAPASGDYCWIQVGGVVTLTPALVSGADGNALTLSTTTDGTLKVAGAVTDSGGAVAIDASAKIVMLNCPR